MPEHSHFRSSEPAERLTIGHLHMDFSSSSERNERVGGAVSSDNKRAAPNNSSTLGLVVNINKALLEGGKPRFSEGNQKDVESLMIHPYAKRSPVEQGTAANASKCFLPSLLNVKFKP